LEGIKISIKLKGALLVRDLIFKECDDSKNESTPVVSAPQALLFVFNRFALEQTGSTGGLG